VALVIATCKATLVILFFMHAKYSSKRTQLIIIAGVFWLATMLFLTLGDYATRSWDVH
jgi:cytochrome c oxidase subunit 4